MDNLFIKFKFLCFCVIFIFYKDVSRGLEGCRMWICFILLLVEGIVCIDS